MTTPTPIAEALEQAEVERIARIIHVQRLPSNMITQDWDSGAILGRDNMWRIACLHTAAAIFASLKSPPIDEEE